MKITFKQGQIATAILVALSLSACARFETRMQANGDFEYQQAELVTPYKTGDFSTDEARDHYVIPDLTEQQKAVGLQGIEVDVRPPTQLLAVIDGVLLDKTSTERTKVWFNASEQSDNMEAKVRTLLDSYFTSHDIDLVSQEAGRLKTGIYRDETVFAKTFSKNVVLRESSYEITLVPQEDGYSIAMVVDALTYQETNEGETLPFKLVGKAKQDVELRFVNALLEHAYFDVKAAQLANDNADSQPLSIKLGFDDNHQSAWIADSDFNTTWRKLPALLTLLNFEIVEHDKNLGYFLVNYEVPSNDYWVEHHLLPFELKSGEYFIQLGEMPESKTSIVWLDSDKKPLPDEQISNIYLSITKQVREVLVEKEKQTKRF